MLCQHSLLVPAANSRNDFKWSDRLIPFDLKPRRPINNSSSKFPHLFTGNKLPPSDFPAYEEMMLDVMCEIADPDDKKHFSFPPSSFLASTVEELV